MFRAFTGVPTSDLNTSSSWDRAALGAGIV